MRASRARSANLAPLESQVQRAILDYLELAKRAGRVAFYWRANAGHTRIPDPSRAKGHRVLRCNFRGCPDILGVLPGGRMLAIEVKAGPKCTPTRDQGEALATLRRAGALVLVAWSVDQVADAIGWAA